MVPSNTDYNYYSEMIDVNFPRRALFDTLYLNTNHTIDTVSQYEIFEIGHSTVPVRRNISITLKPTLKYENQSKAAVFRVNTKNELGGFVGGNWKSDKINFASRDFGRFTIAYDTAPPLVKPLVITSKDLKFKVEDKLSGLKKIECYVNGNWVLMNYDYKRKLIWSEKINEGVPFEGPVKLIVTDNVNNTTKYETNINL